MTLFGDERDTRTFLDNLRDAGGVEDVSRVSGFLGAVHHQVQAPALRPAGAVTHQALHRRQGRGHGAPRVSQEACSAVSDYVQLMSSVLPRINAATHANWFFISPKLCIPPILYMVAVLVSVLRSDLCRGFDDI